MTAPDVARLVAWIEAGRSRILNGWDSDGKARVATMWTGPEPGYTTVAADSGDGVWVADGREVTDARHVHVLYDPAHELAVYAALRAVVELAERWESGARFSYQSVTLEHAHALRDALAPLASLADGGQGQ